ncbi:MAG TPA: phosphatidylcholine/phosphatidylserine synthase [Candidatus Angelobacter sp.]|nr:phosphatidylcholine/phosphatidylserine synthase [Candidatus Angelobacter sp.]
MPVPLRRWEDIPPAQKRRMRKGMYILPSIFTAANIGAGYFAIAHAVQGAIPRVVQGSLEYDYWHFDIAAKAIGFAILADGLDGFVARMTNTTSDFGREFDSLADVITFGLAPALLAWTWGVHMLPDFGHPDIHARIVQLGVIATFIFLVAGASRLARFNIQVNPQPTNPGRPGRKYFVGMPIPAAAGMVAATVHFFAGQPISTWWIAPVWLGGLIFTAMLMVSKWRFYSTKGLNLRSRHPFQIIILLCGCIALVYFFSRYLLLALAIFYMVSGILMRLSWMFRRRPPNPAYQEAPETR